MIEKWQDFVHNISYFYILLQSLLEINISWELTSLRHFLVCFYHSLEELAVWLIVARI